MKSGCDVAISSTAPSGATTEIAALAPIRRGSLAMTLARLATVAGRIPCGFDSSRAEFIRQRAADANGAFFHHQ